MIRTKKLLAGASAIAVSAFGASGAYAVGTASGSSITNTVSVNYQVGGVAQTAVNASNSFTVDRRITLTVAEVGSTTTTVSPGQTAAVTTFLVSNTANATLDFGLSVAQQVGGAGAHANTDNFDVTAPAIYLDNPVTGTVGSYDAGDALVTYLDEIAADTSRTVFVVANVPIARVTGDVAVVTLTAQARDSGVAGTQGAVSAQTIGANTAGVDTVFADTAGATDIARDGQFSARDDYTVSAANLTVTKISRVISDPFNLTVNPKLIPGAVVEYCITVTNAAGGSPATSVAINDPLPPETTYNAPFGIFVDGTVAGGVCSGGTNTGTFAAGTVSGTIASVAAGTTRTLYFQTTIN